MSQLACLRDKPAILPGELRVQVDSFDSETWHKALQSFRDANIYNTWHYEIAVHPKSRVSRILLTKSGSLVGAVQARIIRVPVLGRGLAFIRWGPMWKVRGKPLNPDNLRSGLKAIFEEYAVRRRLLVRVIPVLYEDDGRELECVFLEQGFRRVQTHSPRRTVIMDLTPSMDGIRDNLHVKWRAHLKRASKKGQHVTWGQSDELFSLFKTVYMGMRERKGFVSFTDFEAFHKLQRHLPAREKLLVVLCGTGSEYYSGAIVSALGEVGLYLFGATNGRGLKNNGSYPVQWRVIEWLKEQGCSGYDLNGINPEVNPTTYEYKSRLAGKTRREVRELGMFEACVDPVGRLLTRTGLTLIEFWRNRKLGRNARVLEPAHASNEGNAG
jgi:lipid II:glycine glycyltransferase (peptidoglycan interpeptide bridge formation enzyme)